MSNRSQTHSILQTLLGIAVGLVFILSGLAKLYPVEPLEYTFVELGLAGWETSMVLARLLIGLELLCGVFLLLRFAYRRFTLPLLLVLLTVFSAYLLYQLSVYGNTGDCGCFGGFLKMTPVEGLLKNAALLLCTLGLYLLGRNATPAKAPGKIKAIALVVLSLLGFTLPFVLNPVLFPVTQEVYSRDRSFILNLDTLYTNPLNPPPGTELRQGKWIISFMSLTCPHCRAAAKKLHVMKLRNPSLPIHLILNGQEADRQPFFEDTRADNLSWSILNGPQLFMGLAGNELPRIFWVEDSRVVNESNLYTLDEAQIEAWLQKP